jgi:hypothetical protein
VDGTYAIGSGAADLAAAAGRGVYSIGTGAISLATTAGDVVVGGARSLGSALVSGAIAAVTPEMPPEGLSESEVRDWRQTKRAQSALAVAIVDVIQIALLNALLNPAIDTEHKASTIKRVYHVLQVERSARRLTRGVASLSDRVLERFLRVLQPQVFFSEQAVQATLEAANLGTDLDVFNSEFFKANTILPILKDVISAAFRVMPAPLHGQTPLARFSDAANAMKTAAQTILQQLQNHPRVIPRLNGEYYTASTLTRWLKSW